MHRYATVILLMVLSSSAFSAVTVTQGKGPEGTPVVVMENDLIRLEIAAARGGRISQFVQKSVGQPWFHAGNTGMFMDHVWQQTWPGELLGKTYELKVRSRGPEKGSVVVTGLIEGKGDESISGLRIVREMTIFSGSRRVEATVRLENPTDARKSPGLWIQNANLCPGGTRENNWTYRPTTRGVLAASFSPKSGERTGAEDFIYDPVGGWSAIVDPQANEGCAFLMDYNWLRCLYDNNGSESVEWWYEQCWLAPGDSFQTEVTVWPFRNLKAVSHASRHAVAELKIEQDGANLVARNRIIAGPEGADSLQVRMQFLDYETGRTLIEKTYPVPRLADRAAEQALTFRKAPMEKNVLARVILSGRGWTESYETYRPRPAVEGTETPYAVARPPQARPFQKPKRIVKVKDQELKVLHLRGLFEYYYRIPEAIELLKGKLKSGSYRTFVYGPSLTYFPTDYKELMAYDLIILNNIPATVLDERIQEMIKDFVEHGGAFLVIGGDRAFGGGKYKGSRIEQVLPVRSKGPFDMRPAAEPVVLGPAGQGGLKACYLWRQEFDQVKTGPRVEKAGGHPVWIEMKVKKGAVAVLPFLCFGEAPAGYVGFWEWDGWPDWLSAHIRRLLAATEP